MNRIILIAVILAIAAGVYFNLFRTEPYAIGDQVSDFTLEALNGSRFKLSDYRDRIVFIEFFSTYCSYCQTAYPATGALKEKVFSGHSDVVFVSVNRGENRTQVQEFANNYLKKWPVLLDQNKKVYSHFFKEGVPGFIIIDKGELVYRETGWSATLVDGLAYELEDLELRG